MYVNKEDYKGRISTDLLVIMLEESEATILEQSSKTAEDTIRVHIGTLHPGIDIELQKAGAARNGYILKLAISIALYEIYQRADDENVPAKVIKNHDDAMEDLQKISTGKGVNLNLGNYGEGGEEAGGEAGGPESIQPGGNGLRRIGSQSRRTHQV